MYDRAERGLQLPSNYLSRTSEPLKVKKGLSMRSSLRSSEDPSFQVTEAHANSNFTEKARRLPNQDHLNRMSVRLFGYWKKICHTLSSLVKPTVADQSRKYLDVYLDGYAQFNNSSWEQYPDGWPRIAAFLESCDTFGIYRRFGQCHSRLLLTYQADITDIEQQISNLDKSDEEGGESTNWRLKNRFHEEGLDTVKRDLLVELEQKLLAYDALLLNHNNLKNLSPTPQQDHDSVFKWIWTYRPLDDGEHDWIFHPNDFVSLVPPRRNRFEKYIRSRLHAWPKHCLKNRRMLAAQIPFHSRYSFVPMAGKIDTHKLHVDDPSYGANEECTEDGYFCEDPECLSKYPRHTFSNRSKLNKHINGHRKPFTCTQPGCLKSFSQKQNVDRHARRHHHEASSAIEFYHCTTDECKYASTGSRRKRFARIDQVREHIKDYGHYGPHSPMQREKRPGSPLPANQAVIYYIEKWTSKKSSQIYRVALSLCFHTSKTKLWHLDDTRDIFIRVPDSRLSLLPSDGHQCTVSETCYYQSFWPTSIPITLFKSDNDRREHEHRAHSLGAQAISSTEYQILEADNGFCRLPFAQTLEDMLASECLPPESMFPLDIAHETSYIFNFEESSIKNIGVAAEEASMLDSRYHQSFGEELTLSDQRFVESYHSAKSHQE
ncbi:hypothetical protein B0O99DRAFT_591162 [Bisporella sp. PMI_857]|nr:hypothetical protein B0O99DRAFT_591162 [Bisporella sp. PMI_857]